MSTAVDDLLIAFELHSVDRIRAALDGGIDVGAPMRGKAPIDWLTQMYTRSDRFPACLRILLDRGAELADLATAPVLLDDADALKKALAADPALAAHRTTMVSAFTPLAGASLLHVAAEYGSRNAARALLDAGADVDARAAVDEWGLGGQTPIFHTVNSNENRSVPIMKMLIEAGASPDVRIAGLTWGRGFEWETTVFDVTPLSYAQLGLLPQMHRDEKEIYANIELLLAASKRKVPPFTNVPNRYLRPTKETGH